MVSTTGEPVDLGHAIECMELNDDGGAGQCWYPQCLMNHPPRSECGGMPSDADSLYDPEEFESLRLPSGAAAHIFKNGLSGGTRQRVRVRQATHRSIASARRAWLKLAPEQRRRLCDEFQDKVRHGQAT